MKNIILLLRPHQWLKNLFIFLPLFFDRHLGEISYILPAIVAFFAYSFAASSIYCFNDIYDAEADRLHPKKCKRPIASGAISKGMGYVIMVVMLLFSLATAFIFLHETKWQVIGIIAFEYCLLHQTKANSIGRRIRHCDRFCLTNLSRRFCHGNMDFTLDCSYDLPARTFPCLCQAEG